ncbi:phosphoribosyltransferase family protein [Streptomyces sp. NBC_01262]|uniref:phosphoribosyltransferase family protein n=1 Tax=Streptomyces sp. NBC_01262 TaxID=2903803 RepID=UPI002E31A122|nr:phosphoribosyltransferase family protein [Streptomyces sp. NBC_01262]
MQFIDRTDAGQRLAVRLRHLASGHPVVLGLPRGGVPVAYEVARALDAPLDIVVVRKLGVPYHRELGFGAIGEGGARVVSDDIVRMTHVSRQDLEDVERREEAELARQAHRFRDGRPRTALRGRNVIVVDDGVATGATALAACQVVRAQGAARVAVGVPVGAPDAVAALRVAADEVVCLHAPRSFFAVGEWYGNFTQTGDEEVSALLKQAAVRPPRSVGAQYAAGGVRLAGDLALPAGAEAVVVFAHGTGSSRHSPRNRAVAATLNEAGLGTLLLDLLTPEEEAHGGRAKVFDIGLLARRLTDVTRALRAAEGLAVGFFGASTGAAAALCAAADAADAGDAITAVVSRGGRPDLAGDRLGRVRAPVLLIVGGADRDVLELNRRAQERLRCPNLLHVVPGATHLFEEPGALDQVARLARDWFLGHPPDRPWPPYPDGKG